MRELLPERFQRLAFGSDQSQANPKQERKTQRLQAQPLDASKRVNYNFFSGDGSFRTNFLIQFRKQYLERIHENMCLSSSRYSFMCLQLLFFYILAFHQQLFRRPESQDLQRVIFVGPSPQNGES